MVRADQRLRLPAAPSNCCGKTFLVLLGTPDALQQAAQLSDRRAGPRLSGETVTQFAIQSRTARQQYCLGVAERYQWQPAADSAQAPRGNAQ